MVRKLFLIDKLDEIGNETKAKYIHGGVYECDSELSNLHVVWFSYELRLWVLGNKLKRGKKTICVMKLILGWNLPTEISLQWKKCRLLNYCPDV